MKRLFPTFLILQATTLDRQKVNFIMGTWLIVFAIILILLVVAIFYFNRKK